MDLEKYKKFMVRSCVQTALWGIPIFLIWLVLYTPLKNSIPLIRSVEIDQIMYCAAAGGLIGYFIALLGYVVYTVTVCRNPRLLERRFLKNHDERQTLIMNKASEASFRISLILLILALLIAGAYSPVIFFTLYAVLVLLLMVYGLCKLYYRRKY
jgi:hypothetical protein